MRARAHSAEERRKLPNYNKGRECACGTPIRNENKTGNCKPCNMKVFNADPAAQAKRAESFRRKLREDPLELARRRAQCRQNVRNALARPEVREAWVARARKVYDLMRTPEALEKKRVGHAAAMQRRAAKQLAWCPPEKRERYDYLVYTKRLRAAEARAIILAEIKAELDAMSPFERQMRALERGAKLVANDARPAGNQVVRRFG